MKKFPSELEKTYKKKGINVQTGCSVESVKKDAKGVTVSFKDKDGKAQTLQAEKLLLAVGRKPMTDNCGLEKSKAKLERGFVQVNQYMETAEPGLYAVGDIVAGLPQLAHAAMMEGIVAVTHIAGKPTQPILKTRVPNATYCEPQIGSIGLTEKQARDAGYKVKTGKFPFVGNSKATILGNHGGFIKVVSDETYGEVLGIHIIGPLATEILVGSDDGAAARGHHRRHDAHDARASHGVGRIGRCVCVGARIANQRVRRVFSFQW